MDILLDLGLIIAISVVFAWLLSRAGVTRVLGYIIAGILAGLTLQRVIQPTLIAGFDALSGAALGFVTFLIGEDFTAMGIRRMGVRGPVLATVQALLTFAVVLAGIVTLGTLGLFRLEHLVPEALLLAATATATAPAATFEVIKRLKAHGPVTDTLAMAVTFDDAVGIVVFDISVVVARAMMGGSVAPGWGILTTSLRELGLSFALGTGAGLVFGLAARLLRSRNEVRVLGIGMVLLTVGLSRVWELSPLLASLVLGAVFANVAPSADRVFEDVDHWSSPLLLLFFFLAGATTDFRLLSSAWPVVLVYILLRAVGKIGGSGIGGWIIRAPRSVRRNLGLSMLPQAGLAIGHALVVTSLFPNLTYISMTVVVAVLLFDVVGSWMTRRVLTRCGEAGGPIVTLDGHHAEVVD
ncbi:MAG: cation:proton antiporter [Caldiserica bacterium]|jgi:Kef-type K+ transport system membrane component KefB|nr:cation:proton antiporter [Caldisericota bacterium]